MKFDRWINWGNNNTVQPKGGLPRSQKGMVDSLKELVTARIGQAHRVVALKPCSAALPRVLTT